MLNYYNMNSDNYGKEIDSSLTNNSNEADRFQLSNYNDIDFYNNNNNDSNDKSNEDSNNYGNFVIDDNSKEHLDKSTNFNNDINISITQSKLDKFKEKSISEYHNNKHLENSELLTKDEKTFEEASLKTQKSNNDSRDKKSCSTDSHNIKEYFLNYSIIKAPFFLSKYKMINKVYYYDLVKNDEISKIANSNNEEVNVLKKLRYSVVFEFRKAIRHFYPSLIIPQLPPKEGLKKTLFSIDEEKRFKGLDFFIQSVSKYTNIKNSKLFEILLSDKNLDNLSFSIEKLNKSIYSNNSNNTEIFDLEHLDEEIQADVCNGVLNPSFYEESLIENSSSNFQKISNYVYDTITQPLGLSSSRKSAEKLSSEVMKLLENELTNIFCEYCSFKNNATEILIDIKVSEKYILSNLKNKKKELLDTYKDSSNFQISINNINSVDNKNDCNSITSNFQTTSELLENVFNTIAYQEKEIDERVVFCIDFFINELENNYNLFLGAKEIFDSYFNEFLPKFQLVNKVFKESNNNKKVKKEHQIMEETKHNFEEAASSSIRRFIDNYRLYFPKLLNDFNLILKEYGHIYSK